MGAESAVCACTAASRRSVCRTLGVVDATASATVAVRSSEPSSLTMVSEVRPRSILVPGWPGCTETERPWRTSAASMLGRFTAAAIRSSSKLSASGYAVRRGWT